MKLLILGATGRTGKHVLSGALKAGYAIHALVRDKSKIPDTANLTLFEGTPLDKAVLTTAMKDCDAVVSILNISRNSDFPWAKLRTPKTFLSDSIKNILEVTNELGVKRLIVCSAWEQTKQNKISHPGSGG